MPKVNFFTEDITFQVSKPRKLARWIVQSMGAEQKAVTELNYIFCSDAYLSDLNWRFLRHKTMTDIITFDTSEDKMSLQGDIFISIDRVLDNAQKFNVPFDDELHRVIIHGALHLAGYSDKNPQQKKRMRAKENAYLSLR